MEKLSLDNAVHRECQAPGQRLGRSLGCDCQAAVAGARWAAKEPQACRIPSGRILLRSGHPGTAGDADTLAGEEVGFV